MATGDVMTIGTGADEVRFGIDGYREQAERDLSQAESLDASFDNLRVSTHGDVAFAYVEPVIRATVGGQSLTLDGLRATFGLVRTPDGWRLAQGHLSVPDSQQEPGQSF
jgi:ketosteroid isomerase-like protein